MLPCDGRNMKTQAEKPSCLALLVTAIAIVLFSSAGLARMMGWGSNGSEASGDVVAHDQGAAVTGTGVARAGPRCPECAMIVSVGSDKISVRMADGSSRVLNDANPARWRTGERLIVIAGTGPPPQ